MNLRINLLRLYLPKFIRRRKLEELFDLTAKAFQVPAPAMNGISFKEYRWRYAVFTRDVAAEFLKEKGNVNSIRKKLYESAFKMGSEWKEKLGVRNFSDAMIAGRLLYRAIGIDFQNHSGAVTINRCYFSNIYTGTVCGVISSLDEGILAGLSGGGKLEFSQRITDGNECCQATYRGNPKGA